MKGEVLSNTDLLFMPEITVILFTGVFLGALIWSFRPGSKQAYAARSMMPLVDQPIEALGEEH